MEYLFFLSYAREDGDPYLKRFFEILVDEVKARSSHPKEFLGFKDTRELQVGEEWSSELTDALGTCRVFVPVYSLRYFTREFCGKEWGAFRSRQEAFAKDHPGTKFPARVVPILWVAESTLGSLPTVPARLQFMHEELDPLYAKEGLRYLLTKTSFSNEAQQVIEKLAGQIVDFTKLPVLPPLPPGQNLETMPSVWAIQPAPGEKPQAVGKGPRYVQFLFVAGRKEELANLRKSIDNYGGDAREWKPYLPELPKEVGIVASSIATEEDFFVETLPLDNTLLTRLEEAQQDNRIVAIIVDTWTLRVPEYREAIRAYDQRNFRNCVVLVPWNLKDQETESAVQTLQTALLDSLRINKETKSAKYFVDTITTPDEFKKSISAALNTVKAQILSYAEVEKKTGEQNLSRPIL